MKKILVIGSLNIDMVADVDHTPREGETILCTGFSKIPGGKGANQACALGRLGANVTMIGAVGDDQYAEIQRKSLRDSNVDISKLVVKKGSNTGVAFITVSKNGNNSIVVASGANEKLSENDIMRNLDLISECDAILLQLEIPIKTVIFAAKKAKELGKTVILDPAPVPKEFPVELFQYADIIKPNETELSMLSGIDNAENDVPEAVSVLRKMGAKEIVVTLGDKGVYVDSEKSNQKLGISAKKVSVVDTTAAGDAFTAALAMMIVNGENVVRAAEFANKVSSIVVTRKGAQSSIPSLETVMKLDA